MQEQITAEVSRATTAESEMDGKITAETSRATGVENELRGLITTETERATAAEGALGDRIDGLEGELEGVTGEDSPFIRKDGTTTTTGKIPLAQGGTSEVDPAAATDLVNLRSMQAADQALESSMTEYVDNQLEAVTGDIHSIPAGGTAGQVLAKKSATDYDTHWIDPPSGSDPDAIKKDGTTTTTATIPFAKGATFGNEIISHVRNSNLYIEKFSGIPRSHLAINGDGTSELLTTGNGTDWWGVVNTKNGLQLRDSASSTGSSGQVLTAKGDGTCGWADAGVQASIIGSNDDLIAYRVGDLVLLYTNREFYYGITSSDLKRRSTLFNGYYYSHSESVSTSNLGFVFPTTGDYSTSAILSYSVGATDLQEIHAFRADNSITISYRTMQDTQITTETVNMLIPDKTFIGSYVVPE